MLLITSLELLLLDIDTSIQLLTHLGWCINEGKSNLLPSRGFLYLRLLWNTVQHTVVVLQDKLKHYTKIGHTVLGLYRVKLVQLQSLAGSLNFASITSPLLQLRIKDLHCLTRWYFPNSCPLPHLLRSCILYCISLLRSMGSRSLTIPESSLIAYKDASLSA